MNKKTALQTATFGSRIAEDEVEQLRSYFVKTEQCRKVIVEALPLDRALEILRRHNALAGR